MTRFVDLDTVVATAKSIIGEASEIDRTLFCYWTWLGLKEIGPNDNHIVDCDIKVVNLRIKKPQDCYKPADLALYNADNREVRYKFNGAVGERVHEIPHENTIFLSNVIDISEDKDYFHLDSNANGVVSYAKLRYYKFPIDELGNPLVPQEQEMALAFWIAYLYSVRMKEPAVQQQLAASRWREAKLNAIGEQNTPHMIAGTQIAREFNSMIQRQVYKNF